MPRLLLTTHTVSSQAELDVDAELETIILADGAEFLNNGVERLLFKNGSLAARTITVVTPFQQDALDLEDRVYTVAAGDTIIAGPFSRAVYSQTGNKVYINVSGEDVDAVVFK